VADRPAGERTEQPTARRLAEARRRGEVARSRDLGSAVVLAAFVVVAALGAGPAVGRLVVYLRATLAGAAAAPAGPGALAAALGEASAALTLPLGIVALAALVAGVAQTGGLFTFQPVRLEPGRVLPSARRVLSAAALAEVGKGLVVIALVGALAWVTARSFLPALAHLPGRPARSVLGALAALAETFGVRVTLAALALGALDYLWQRARHQRGLRMTREEVKREVRETEGDPRHKIERQRLHRALSEQRMLADVRKADFVVVNPEHIAVALRYDRDGQSAPRVVAKGERLLAERIKEVAREAGVPIFRDVSLARSLGALEEGDEIPEALYEAVAEILRVVYEMAPPAAPSEPPSPPAAGWRRG
jgi:flagellar biosynthesis protein FlhB